MMKYSHFSSLFNTLRNAPRHVSLYSTAAPKSHRKFWKGSLNGLYRQISRSDPKASVLPILDRWVQNSRTVDKDDLVTIIKELRYYKDYSQALEVSMWMSDKRYVELLPDKRYVELCSEHHRLFRLKSSLFSPDEAISLEPLFNFYSRLPGVSLYSTTAKSPPSTSHRTHWKGTLNRLYGRISKIADPKAPIHPILDQWIQQGRPVDKVGLVFMIKELKHFKRFDNALQVSMWMTDKRYFELSPADAAVRLDLIAKVHGVEQAESYFDNIPIQLKSLGVYLALLNCYAHAKLVEKAEATMQKIRDLGLARTSLAYNNLLNLYYQTGKRDKLDVLVNEMEEKGIQCNKFTYGILLSAYAAASDFEAVEKILAQWESHPDCRLDWINYAVVANVYIKAGNEDKALAMLKKSEELIPSSERRREAYEIHGSCTIDILPTSTSYLLQALYLWEKLKFHDLMGENGNYKPNTQYQTEDVLNGIKRVYYVQPILICSGSELVDVRFCHTGHWVLINCLGTQSTCTSLIQYSRS